MSNSTATTKKDIHMVTELDSSTVHAKGSNDSEDWDHDHEEKAQRIAESDRNHMQKQVRHLSSTPFRRFEG
jgi:hypothetical protein